MWIQLDKRFPWIEIERQQGIAYVRDTRTGQSAPYRTEHELMSFVAAHSATEGHGGLGDAIRSITRRLGFGGCTPCAKRQAALNSVAPRLFRRR